MEEHSVIGERILANVEDYREIATIVRHHHERWDGKGYPDGLAGTDIPLHARIIAVCDTYDAITSERAYAAARSHDDAIAELQRCAGGQFDPRVVDAFCAGNPVPPERAALAPASA